MMKFAITFSLLVILVWIVFSIPAHPQTPHREAQRIHVSHKKTKAKKKIFVSCVSLYGYKYQMEAEDLARPQFLTASAPLAHCQVVPRSTI